MQCELVHAIPGRARIRLDEPEVFNGMAGRFRAFLGGLRGVSAVRLSAASRSVVVTYDPVEKSPESLLTAIRTRSPESLAEEEAGQWQGPDESSIGPLALSTAAILLR